MKLLRNLTIFTSVLFAVTIFSAIYTSAYPYSSETGFDVPYNRCAVIFSHLIIRAYSVFIIFSINIYA